MHDENSYVTLTYNDENLPADGCVSLRELQLFIKRLRKEYGEGIKFFACGEYGEKLGRPHYHLCLFNFETPEKKFQTVINGNRLYSSKPLEEKWGNGYTLTGQVTFQSAAYVARYIMKKINGPAADKHYITSHAETGEILSEKKPEFVTMSTKYGIGRSWYKKFYKDVYPHDYVVINGRKMRPPKYYDRLYEIDFPDEFQKIKSKRLENSIKHAKDNTPERLAVREHVKKSKISRLKRGYDQETKA